MFLFSASPPQLMQPDYSIQYGRFHDDSDEHAECMARYFWNLIKDVVPPDRTCRILDVGCGFGFALRGLRNAGYWNVLGLEVSPQQAARACKANLSVEIVPDTATWLTSHREEFDLVLLLDVLEHVAIANQVQLLTAIRSSLKVEGQVFVQVPNANAILASRWRYNDFTHHSSFTEHSLSYVLENAGFSGIEISSEKGIGRIPKRLWRQSDRDDLRKWLVRWLWLQVFKAELPWERLDDISFELNLRATARA